MAEAADFFRPNWMKLVLALTLLFPIFMIFVFILSSLNLAHISTIDRFVSLLFRNIDILIFLVCLAGYLIGCLLDYFLKSRTLKILIAVVAAFVSILLGFSIISMRVCDPVHRPMVCDPVHTPGSCENACRDAVRNSGMTALVRQKLSECLQGLSR